MNRILVVDDDVSFRTMIAMRLETAGYEAVQAVNGEEGLNYVRESHVDMTIADLRLGDMDGIRLMEEIHKIRPGMSILIMTGYGSIESAVDAMKKGAQGYLTKPFDHRELLLHVERCIEKQHLVEEVARLKELVKGRYGFENIVGQSGKMQRVLEQISMAAGIDSVVHIEGESGTGKELIARTLHVGSHRRDRPFIAVNCAAIPETLIESELFGHEKGAFTGAVKAEKGHFRRASGGSLFLDEISELTLSVQPKLLRVLEEQQVQPVGGGNSVDIDVRIITASNKNLRQEVEKGNFREDLFYRIHVIPIHIPPLRERKESIPSLSRHFLIDHAQKMNKPARRFAPGAMQKLLNYDWPGNVRELKNTVEYAVAMAPEDVITEDLLLLPSGGKPGRELPTLKEARDRCDRDYLTRIIMETGGNVSAAAKLAGKYRADLYALFRKHKINPEDFRKSDGNA